MVHYELPSKCSRLKEPMINSNSNTSKQDGIGLLISADENRADLILNENLDISNHKKRPSMNKINDKKRSALETNDEQIQNCDKDLIEIDSSTSSSTSTPKKSTKLSL